MKGKEKGGNGRDDYPLSPSLETLNKESRRSRTEKKFYVRIVDRVMGTERNYYPLWSRLLSIVCDCF